MEEAETAHLTPSTFTQLAASLGGHRHRRWGPLKVHITGGQSSV